MAETAESDRVSLSDHELLRAYVRDRSDPAFAELVHRYIDFVYSAALRQMRDAHLSEDCTQAVFLLLAKKAGALSRDLPLAGWLHNAVRYVCANATRAANIRRRHEMKAAEELAARGSQTLPQLDAELESRLDQALSRLRTGERNAILLRYFKGLSAREVGQSLKISEEAAQKRVSRGLENLRRLLSPVGSPAISASAVVAAVSCGVAAAPRSVVAATLAAQHTPAAASLAKGAMVMMTVSKIQAALVTLAVVLCLLTAGGFALHHYLGSEETNLPVAPGGISSPGRAALAPIPPGSVSGVVVDATGTPLNHVEVCLATATSSVKVYAPPSAQGAYKNTDFAGRFFFPADATNRAVIVCADQGFARATMAELKSQGKLTLQPWARIEGTLYLSTNPMPNETIHLSRTRFGSAAEAKAYGAIYDERTQTDAQGHYAFARVAPGDTWISWLKTPGKYDVQFVYRDVKAGDLLTVNIGGRGRPVTGRVVYDGTRPFNFYGSVWPVQAHAMKQPITWMLMSQAARDALTAEWEKSPDARIFDQERCPIDFRITSDGAFTIPDLPAGKYLVSIANWNGPVMGKDSTITDRVRKIITVPDMPGGRSDEPLDIGEMVSAPTGR